jgi:hypothetical protein
MRGIYTKYIYRETLPTSMPVCRLLARRASRRPGTPLERKVDAFGRPNSGGKGKLFSIISLSILI